jgi:hypothetical protein
MTFSTFHGYLPMQIHTNFAKYPPRLGRPRSPELTVNLTFSASLAGIVLIHYLAGTDGALSPLTLSGFPSLFALGGRKSFALPRGLRRVLSWLIYPPYCVLVVTSALLSSALHRS